jgi:hypothetical protein
VSLRGARARPFSGLLSTPADSLKKKPQRVASSGGETDGSGDREHLR